MEFDIEALNETNYQGYLLEEERKDFSQMFVSMEETQNQFNKSLKTIQEYMNYYLIEQTPSNTDPETASRTNSDKREQTKIDSDTIRSIKGIYDMLKQSEFGADTASYDAVPAYAQVEKISDMPFPRNIIFFIVQLVKWIKNLVLSFIDKFTSRFRVLLGMPTVLDKNTNKPITAVTPEELKLNLQRVKTIQKSVGPLSAINSHGAVPGLISYRMVNANDVNNIKGLHEAYNYLVDPNKKNTDPVKVQAKEIPIVQIDTSKDLLALKEYLQHFLDLFDNAYGSNNEHLFGTDDLTLMLSLFQKTLKMVTKGQTPNYEVNGRLTELDAIDSSKLKDNLIRTRINTDNLKAAYANTNNQINVLVKIITHKQLLALDDMGVTFKYLSVSTYEQLIDILQVVNTRITEGKKLEKNMEAVKAKYENLVKELQKIRIALSAVGNLAYTSMQQKRINNLFDGARYMTMAVTLRLTCLGLYVKELEDIREVLTNISSIASSKITKKIIDAPNKPGFFNKLFNFRR